MGKYDKLQWKWKLLDMVESKWTVDKDIDNDIKSQTRLESPASSSSQQHTNVASLDHVLVLLVLLHADNKLDRDVDHGDLLHVELLGLLLLALLGTGELVHPVLVL